MHGTICDDRDGQLIRISDRTGHAHAQLAWRGDTLVRLDVAGATIHGAVIRHPLLGDAHVVGGTAISALAWHRPTEIPTIAEPGRLPAGAGGAILNTIAILAQRAGVPALRYAGPYPTAALWRTLARSFRTSASEAEFSADLGDRMVRLARDELAIEFWPAPCARIAIAGGHVELRDRLERAVIDGLAYEPGGSPARLVRDGAHWAAEVWFGDAPYARVATLTDDGTLAAGPHPIPPSTSAVIGRAFPPELRAAIGELVADAVPLPLATAARAALTASPVRWADLGGRAARYDRGGFEVHAALWDRIAPHGLARVALAIAEALVPVVTAQVVAALARAT